MLAWGWTLEQDQARFTSNRDSVKRRASKANIVCYPGFSFLVLFYKCVFCDAVLLSGIVKFIFLMSNFAIDGVY